jgi:hypothetical protein
MHIHMNTLQAVAPPLFAMRARRCIALGISIWAGRVEHG